jgi:hypothetical protein
MYIGHLAVGFGMRAVAVKSAPRTTPSLGTCMLATAPDAGAVALTNPGGWLLVAWAYWIDRHRVWA